jgi:DNA-binding CsgD family transcriptional regulator
MMSARRQHTDGDETRLELLERSEVLERLAAALDATVGGHGRLVLLAGEAGVGKTVLIRRFCREHRSVRVLWGSCERLFTPRALGAFLDVAQSAGGGLADVASTEGASSHAFLVALVEELRREPPAILVLEDVHWADESTLDVLKLLARRISALPVLALASFRDDQIRAGDPLQIVLGELAGAPAVERVTVSRLSAVAVRRLAAHSGADAARLYELTAGNPFFVTEVLAGSDDAEIPATVRDAVLARVAQLEAGPRRLLEAAAVVPSRIEMWLLEAIAGDELAQLDVCLGSGILRVDDGAAVAFRHELARIAVEGAVAPDRRIALHRAVLAQLAASPDGRVDPARLAHHAAAAGDDAAVVRYAPAAAERAAALRAHREAAELFKLALDHAAGVPRGRRTSLLERRAYECYLTGQIDDSLEARRGALTLQEQAGSRVAVGDSHRWLSRLAWFAGDNATAWQEAQLAVELLEAEPAGRELAMAYSNAAQLRMLADDTAGALALGDRAIALAEQLAETEILVHALNNVGTAELARHPYADAARLERSLALALEAGLEEHVARAYTNLGSSCARRRELLRAERFLTAGIAYCEAHDLDSWRLYMVGWLSGVHLDTGRWDAADRHAQAVLRHRDAAVPARITPLVVLGRLRARRGVEPPWLLLDEALEAAAGTAEPQRLLPVALARAEARWLEGTSAKVAEETDAALALARGGGDRWALGELLAWRRRAGIEPDGTRADALATPCALEAAGDWRAAGEQWDTLGYPYEAALARAESDEQDLLREALGAFQRLGAEPAARVVARHLRRLGARGIGRGPRRATIANPAQLTARQLEIVDLLGEQLTNGEIAARLYLSPKTVEHHVSAILAKLGVRSRRDVAREARRLTRPQS